MRKTQLTIILTALLITLATSTFIIANKAPKVVSLGQGRVGIIIDDEDSLQRDVSVKSHHHRSHRSQSNQAQKPSVIYSTENSGIVPPNSNPTVVSSNPTLVSSNPILNAPNPTVVSSNPTVESTNPATIYQSFTPTPNLISFNPTTKQTSPSSTTIKSEFSQTPFVITSNLMSTPSVVSTLPTSNTAVSSSETKSVFVKKNSQPVNSSRKPSTLIKTTLLTKNP